MKIKNIVIYLLGVFWFINPLNSVSQVSGNKGRNKENITNKFINTFDYDCDHFKMMKRRGNVTVSIDSGVKYEGEGSLKCEFAFSGNQNNRELITLRKMWGMFRSDLSFYPLELSLWVKSSSPSNNKVIIHLLQQNKDYTLTNDSLKVFSFRSSIDLSETEWQQITIPYNLFVEDKEGRGDPIDLKRVVGYEFGVENTSGKAHEFTMNFDSFQQFTSFKPTFNKKNKFSSIFIQLHASLHEHLDWEPTFKAYRAVGIDTVILQQAVRNDKTGSVSNYKGTKLPNIIKQYQMIENAFTAATKTGMKVILGLNAGKYPINKNEATVYDQLYEINKIIVDELYNKFSNNKMMVGWYISEEYHDGAWRGWWKPEDAYLLSHYQERVASYAKSKEKKFLVTIAPALWRGRPADMTYEFYKRILEKTPSVDILYLQDCAGRLNILNDDLIIDLPNYFAMVKKACDETGVKFGVDIESFTKGNCTIKRGTKEWEDLKLLLDIAGMYTQNISQFSWHSFRPGVGAFSNYEKYINE